MILSVKLQILDSLRYYPEFGCSTCLLSDRGLNCWILAGESLLGGSLPRSSGECTTSRKQRFYTLTKDAMRLNAAVTHDHSKIRCFTSPFDPRSSNGYLLWQLLICTSERNRLRLHGIDIEAPHAEDLYDFVQMGLRKFGGDLRIPGSCNYRGLISVNSIEHSVMPGFGMLLMEMLNSTGFSAGTCGTPYSLHFAEEPELFGISYSESRI
ncbi:hypothetical protein Trydic_g18736 [Trypoxylus dichotomus]